MEKAGNTMRAKREPNLPLSLCVAVWSGAWKAGMLSPSCALCPGTAVRLRGTLPPGPSGNTRDSQPERAHQIDAKLPFDQWMITVATRLERCVSSFLQAWTHYQCSPSFTSLLKLLSQPDANLQLNNKYRFDLASHEMLKETKYSLLRHEHVWLLYEILKMFTAPWGWGSPHMTLLVISSQQQNTTD